MPTHSPANLSVQQLRKAVTIKEQIEALEEELSQALGAPASAAAARIARPKRTMSASARARIAAAQRARWAKVKGGAASKPASAPRRTMSAAARAKMAAAAKARWKKAKAEGKTSLAG